MNRKKCYLIALVILSILYVSSLGLSQEPRTLLREYEPILYLYPNDEYDEYVPMNLEPYVEERCSLWHKKVDRPLVPEGKVKLTFLGDPRIDDWSDFYLWFDEESEPPFFLPAIEPEWGPFDEIFKPYAEAALEEYSKITDKSIIYHGHQTEDNGYTVLQYWFFYAYNPWGAYEFGINIHEGDWEMVSIFLEPQGEELIPRYAAYSAHHDSGDEVTRVWDEVEKIGVHPIVYVALGSHANYFDNGLNGLHFRKELPGLVDVTTPHGRHIGPGQDIEWDEPFILEDGNLPLWADNYDGKWGADWKIDDGKLKDGLSGPKGPKFQGDKWDNPADWAGLPACGWPSDPAENVPICTAENVQYSHQLVTDGVGGAIITWEDWRSGAPDIYAQRVNSSGVVLWTTDGVPICTATGWQVRPQLVSDGAGGAIITWADNRSDNGDIYARRVDSSGTVLWTTDGVEICTAEHDQQSPELASDGAGGAIITWRDHRSGDYYDIYAQRVDASGKVQWTTDGVPICTAEDNQNSPRLVSDGAGGAIITWMDFRSGDSSDVYAQRVDSSGRVLWTTNGVPICTAADWQRDPQLVSDGAGGAIITWQDDRSDDGDIYAQRVDPSGSVLWTTDGVPICTAAYWQWSPQLVSDGAGGAIITWEDSRSGNDDIYTQRVDSSGRVLWTTDGAPICTAAYDQYSPQLVSDGAGGAIISWMDTRSGNYDIYAQNVQEDGSLGGISGDGGALALAPKMFPKREISPSPDLSLRGRGDHGIPLTTKALQNYPNPFNPDTWIPYRLAVDAPVTITIYNLKGQLIRTIALGNQKAGVYVTKGKAAYWDGRDDVGEKVGSGVYFYTLQAGEFVATRKMLIVK